MILSSGSQALPVAAVFGAWGRRPPAPWGRLVDWCVLLILADLVDVAVGLRYGSNAFTSQITLPLEVGLTLRILAPWQSTPAWRAWYDRALWAILLVVAALLILTDPEETFDIWVSPLLSLLALAALVHTLVSRALRSDRALPDQDWFWVCLGMSLFWAVAVPAPPFLTAFLAAQWAGVVATLIGRGYLNIVAFLLISWGVVCPRVRTRSSRHS
jgi:hypothetical protein